MAGKHVGAHEAGVQNVGPNYIPGGRIDRAYSEGRQAQVEGGVIGDNPHIVIGSPERAAWNSGFFSTVDEQFETCWVT